MNTSQIRLGFLFIAFKIRSIIELKLKRRLNLVSVQLIYHYYFYCLFDFCSNPRLFF